MRIIPAQELRGVALRALQTMRNPGSWAIDADYQSTTADDKPVSVWSFRAVKFSDLGHLYKAAQKQFNSPPELDYGAALTEDGRFNGIYQVQLSVDLIDALVREYTFQKYKELISFTTLSVSSKESAIKAIEWVAARLKLGDDVLVDPEDVGVMTDIEQNGNRKPGRPPMRHRAPAK